MARRPARWAVAAGVTVAALVAASAVGGTAAPVRAKSAGAATTAAAPDPAGPDAIAAARSPYERRHLLARRDSLDLAPVVDGWDRPNVLVFMTDDMREDDLQFMPNARRLIGEAGVHFTNSFAPHPLCCPSRASFVTGRYSHNHGVWSHVPPFGFPALDDDETLPVWLQRAGYRTSFLGKYLNSYGEEPLLDGRPSLRYVPPGWTDWRASVDSVDPAEDEDGRFEGSTYRYFDTTLSVNGRLEPYEGKYQTHLYGRIAQDMLRRDARAAAPFFTWVSFTAPHSGSPVEPDDPEPLISPDGLEQKLRNPARPEYVRGRFDQHIVRGPGGTDSRNRVEAKPAFVRERAALSPEEEDALLVNHHQRAEALSVVDDEIANVMQVLENTGELDNTYVLLTSDNGFFLGEHRRRQGKILAYEPSLRVPLLMRGPGIPRGEERSDPFLTIDVAPTLLDAGGAASPEPLDGVSLLDVARTGDRGWTRGVLTDTGPIRVDSPLLEIRDPVRMRKEIRERRVTTGIRTGRWTYLQSATGERELYDLRRDPFQWVNLFGRPRYDDLVRLLAAEVDRLRTCRGTECAEPLDPRLRTSEPAPARFVATTVGQGATLTR